jgi:hypothetical protein
MVYERTTSLRQVCPVRGSEGYKSIKFEYCSHLKSAIHELLKVDKPRCDLPAYFVEEVIDQ